MGSENRNLTRPDYDLKYSAVIHVVFELYSEGSPQIEFQVYDDVYRCVLL